MEFLPVIAQNWSLCEISRERLNSYCWIWLCFPSWMPTFFAYPNFVVAGFFSFLPRFYLWVTVGISSCFILYTPFFAILSHCLLLYSFLIIISNSHLPLLPFSSEIFSDLEEKLPHSLLVDSCFCIHLSQSLNTDLLKN